jgi:hypothetical protein
MLIEHSIRERKWTPRRKYFSSHVSCQGGDADDTASKIFTHEKHMAMVTPVLGVMVFPDRGFSTASTPTLARARQRVGGERLVRRLQCERYPFPHC